MTLMYQKLLFASIVAVAAGWASEAPQPFAPENPSFRVDSALVLVPITVVDRRGAIVSGLASSAFTLTEDGVQQQIRSFNEEEAPVSMGFVLDLSGSMKKSLGTAKESLRTLMNDANPADEAFLNVVSTRPRPYSDFTRNIGEILSRIICEDAGGDTALIDTIYGSLKQLRAGVHTRKALLIISDGMDNHSRYSRGELLGRAVESDAQIYTIVPAEAAYAKPIQLMEQKRGLVLLDELAAKTGGISFVVRDRSDIALAAASIGQALRNQYILGYTPEAYSHNGQWRRIRVKVAGSGLRAYARAGYYLD